jgi:hypothetical protein
MARILNMLGGAKTGGKSRPSGRARNVRKCKGSARPRVDIHADYRTVSSPTAAANPPMSLISVYS